ncbi:MAG: polysaccharide deacetylase family protein, partial [Oscillospiraceae bacterium]
RPFMKFGSVEFFKRLIVATFILLVVLPLVLAVAFGFLYAGERGRADRLQTEALALEDSLALLTPETVPAPAETPPTLKNATLAPATTGTTPTPSAFLEPSFDYQLLYPDLYAQRPAAAAAENKVCYLTFDDGPSSTTLRILETLKQYDIKAAFFVTGEASQQNPDILRAIADGGHTLGVHSWCHEYGTIYASVEAFLEDFERMYREIVDVTGVQPTIFRFAGGSINNHNMYTYDAIVAEMLRRGFTFYDWNAAGSDAVTGGLTSTQVTANVLHSAAGRERALVLLHDRPDTATTATALPAIIEGLAAQGFEFAQLTAEVKPITFYYQE